MRNRIISFLLVAVMAISICTTTAFAAKTHTTGGDGKSGVTFTIKTNSSSSSCKLSFSQKKGVYAYQNNFTGTSTCKTYGSFCIYVKEVGGSSKAYDWDYKSSTTITLKKNRTYEVSVVPTQNQFVYRDLKDARKIKNASFLGWSWNNGHWSTYPTWTISTKATLSNVKTTAFSTKIY